MLAVAIRPVEAAPERDVVTAVRSAAPAAHAEAPRRDPTASPTPEAPALAFRPAETPTAATAAPVLRPTIPARRDSSEPLDAERSRLHVTVSRRFLAKLEAAKDALSHARPGASAEEILEAGLDLLLSRHAKRKGLVSKPRKAVRPSETGAVPAHVKRAVWSRAGGRCEWRLESGERCGCTARLEFDHVVPLARGGPSTIENVRLTCRPHNDMAARLAFGDDWMDQFTRKRGRDGSARPAAP